MPYSDGRNEFRELSEVLLAWKAPSAVPDRRESVLNFSLGVGDAFKARSGQPPLSVGSPQKATAMLRQLAHDRASMNQLALLLSPSYSVSFEFKDTCRLQGAGRTRGGARPGNT